MLYLCLKFLTFKTIPQSLRASSLYTREPLFRQSKGTNLCLCPLIAPPPVGGEGFERLIS